MNFFKRYINKLIALLAILALCVVTVYGTASQLPRNPIDGSYHEIHKEKVIISQSKEQEERGGRDENKKEEKEEKEPEEEPDDMKESEDASDTDGDGETGEETIVPTDNQQASIATDLRNQTISEKELKNHTFKFYAYIINPEKDMSLKVKLRNGKTPGNGKYLSSKDENYEATLTKGWNYITLFLKKGEETYYRVTYAIEYTSINADEHNPEVGEHPPVINTNLDGRTKNIKNRNFIFTVSAKSYRDKFLSYDNLRVTFDGKTLKTTPTGTNTYEYDLYFKNPAIGDSEAHTVTVLAWDGEGNSRFKKYTVVYEFTDEGQVIGSATINIDATTIGLGVISSGYKYEVKQDEPASYAILEALEHYGFSAEYSGSNDSGFYLKGISGGYIARGASVPSNLWEKVRDDGLNLTGQHSKNRIAEFDYTEGSGWMYTVDGSLYPGRGLSSYYLEDGDTVTLRFTLAYGKDLGATSSRGRLSSYCGLWINGGYRANHKMGDMTVVEEAKCESPGKRESRCKVSGCKEVVTETIQPLGHKYVVKEKVEPTEDTEGYILYRCSRCGDEKRETLPATGMEEEI